jgi:O-succinylbenzoic acid--CoA ligase
MLSRLIEARGDRPWPTTLRCVLLGGSAAPPDLVASALERGIPVAPTYGLTEAASQVATLLPDEVAARPGAAGRPLPLTRVRVANDVRPAAVGEPGEIEISGPTVFAGYLGEPDAAALTADGWFRTGDIGCFDDDGYLSILDRRHDLIVSGGENIYPAEIENALAEHPAVADVAVIGVPDARWGETVKAIVVPRPGTDARPEAIIAFARARLAHFKCPTSVDLVEALPRNPSGKILKRALREPYWRDRDRRIN